MPNQQFQRDTITFCPGGPITGPGFGCPPGCVVSSGKHLEYVNVSGCWREIYNFSYYWKRARLP